MTVQDVMVKALELAQKELNNYKQLTDWIEDNFLKNPPKKHICPNCNVAFTGHSKRVICKWCAEHSNPEAIKSKTKKG